MAVYWSDFRYQHGSASLANIRINFTSAETRRIVLPHAENHTIVSAFVWAQYRNVTDVWMDRQNPSGYYCALHCEQYGRAV